MQRHTREELVGEWFDKNGTCFLIRQRNGNEFLMEIMSLRTGPHTEEHIRKTIEKAGLSKTKPRQKNELQLIKAVCLLQDARTEILQLRSNLREANIRITAIDDMLCLLHGKPGTKTGGGEMAPDVCSQIRELFQEVGAIDDNTLLRRKP